MQNIEGKTVSTLFVASGLGGSDAFIATMFVKDMPQLMQQNKGLGRIAESQRKVVNGAVGQSGVRNLQSLQADLRHFMAKLFI